MLRRISQKEEHLGTCFWIRKRVHLSSLQLGKESSDPFLLRCSRNTGPELVFLLAFASILDELFGVPVGVR